MGFCPARVKRGVAKNGFNHLPPFETRFSPGCVLAHFASGAPPHRRGCHIQWSARRPAIARALLKKLSPPAINVTLSPVNFLAKLKNRLAAGPAEPEHLRLGKLGERAAETYLKAQGLKFLARNFRSARGEIDLVFRDADCLVFAEVKTRSSEEWTRPAAAVDARKRRLLTLTALDYLRLLNNPPVKIRFDIVEVLLRDGAVREIRHLPNTFAMSRPYRYG
jgi:putative endonuclease